MTTTGLPLRTAVAVVVLAVIGALSIPPTLADDAPPEVAETTTTNIEATESIAETTTTTAVPETEAVGETTTTVADTTTTTAASTTTTTTTTPASTTTTTAPPTDTTTTTTAPPTTTTTAAPDTPDTTTTTVPPATSSTTTTVPDIGTVEVPPDDVDADACHVVDDPTAIDTDADETDGVTPSSTSTTTTAPIDDRATTDGEETLSETDEIDPCADPDDEDVGFTPVERIEVVRDIVFPIVGRAGYYDGFGACRDGCAREHHGIDIGTYGWKGLPVVASHDGTVTRVTYDQRLAGCAVILRGDDGWESRYVHLNTDAPGTDVTGYECLAPGVEVGAEVVAGQILGWVGDSGNAENTIPHIHFEIRNPDGVPVNAYESLKAARTIEFEWLSANPSIAYSDIAASNYSPSHSAAVIVTSEEARKLSASENSASNFDSPVLVIDRADPDRTLEQIQRLELDEVVIVSDLATDWIVELVSPHVATIETEAFPLPYTPPVLMLPDGAEVEAVEPNPVDQFATIVAGTLEDIAPDDIEGFEQFTVDHRSIVLSSDTAGATELSSVTTSAPPRGVESEASRTRARKALSSDDSTRTPLLLWWNTGDEWVWSEDPLDVPQHGDVYLTVAQATPWTLTFLGNLAELPPMPIWRG